MYTVSTWHLYNDVVKCLDSDKPLQKHNNMQTTL